MIMVITTVLYVGALVGRDIIIPLRSFGMMEERRHYTLRINKLGGQGHVP